MKKHCFFKTTCRLVCKSQGHCSCHDAYSAGVRSALMRTPEEKLTLPPVGASMNSN